MCRVRVRRLHHSDVTAVRRAAREDAERAAHQREVEPRERVVEPVAQQRDLAWRPAATAAAVRAASAAAREEVVVVDAVEQRA